MRATQYVATVRLMESRFQRPPFRPVLSQLVLRAIVHTIQEYLLALLKPTSIVLWHSLTSLRLGSDTTGQIVIPCVHCLRRVLSALRTLQVLRLNRFAWPASSDNLPIADFLPSPSFSQPKDLSIWAERDWLLDRRSAYLVTWIARSGMANTLQAIHFEWMTILNEPLLMAVASVIEASSGTLRGILVRAGPDISLSPRVRRSNSSTYIYHITVPRFVSALILCNNCDSSD
ncbi:uncharacterized protein PHACADRAFT_214387 [Phanerochaete carnosa HHB-10118-sp]|uniref:Uncharacterized protein n=1 Tax=Phanerochaete carnosa (strain HHB-10118-sp) TaxID=650164 RepID=K5VFG1_PHACS|nr:uncharacterized protein PHACADRAFT_214387 [Phanerochaete carnosa HHB-10118-sp]EKM49873.1 hypothetical protein PHACADRAFT_214387 [Phanerochaete carnosa HHB-10118-sp]